MTKNFLKKLLREKTCGCVIQHTGWPCGTCFFAISEKLTNKDWQTVLLFRGDYKRKDLNNIPKDKAGVEKQLERIVKIISK
jgi:hypothetical protein